MAGGPLVSMIVPVYNAGSLLRPAIESVVGQTHRNMQIIVFDDGSTDGCVDAVRDIEDPRIVWMHQENRGKSAAMNAALDAVEGEFWAVTDADDINEPHRVERQLAVFSENRDVAGVFCGHDMIIRGKRMAPRFRDLSREECEHSIANFLMPAHDPTAMYRTEMVRDERYAEDVRVGEGIDFILRVGERWPLLVLGETLYHYRVWFESLTRSDPVSRDEQVRRVLKWACERRGAPYDEIFPPRPDVPWTNNERENGIAASFVESVIDSRRAGRLLEAVRTGLRCASLHPLDRAYYKALCYALLPSGASDRIRVRQAARRDRAEIGRGTIPWGAERGSAAGAQP